MFFNRLLTQLIEIKLIWFIAKNFSTICILSDIYIYIYIWSHIGKYFCEANLFNKIDNPAMYYHYVDDTFCLFKNEKDADSFLIQLNSMHSSLKSSVEKESDHQLAFLDIFVNKISHFCIQKAHVFWPVYEMGFILPTAAQNQLN